MSDHDSPSSAVQRYTQLLSLAVHELRTPVSVVGGYLRMLQQDEAPHLADRHRKLVAQAEQSCSRLAALVNELSEIGRFDEGQMTFQDEVFDLATLIEEVAAATHEAADRGVRLEVRPHGAGARVRGDKRRLRSAFDALFRSVLREQGSAAVVIADCRISREGTQTLATLIVCEESLVDWVTSAPRTTFNEHRGGLGLALPLARRVIERHEGRIWSPETQTGARTPAVGLSLPVID